MNTTILTGFLRPKIVVPPTVKRLVPHVLLFVAAFVLMGKLCGFLCEFMGFLSVLWMCVVTILGCVHLWALYRFHDWASERGLHWETIFTCGVNLLGGLAFFLIASKNKDLAPYVPLLFGASWLFCLPYFLDKTMALHVAIPAKEYPIYTIPDEWSAKASMAFEESELGVIWRFEEDGKGDLPQEDERIFAPRNVSEIQFGMLFGAFLLWHNTRLRLDKPIRVGHPGEGACRWEFFHRRYWFFPWLSRIDPNRTVGENRLHFRKRKSKIDPNLEVRAPLIYVRRLA